MIDVAVDYVRKEVRDYLGVADGDVITGHIPLLSEDTNASGLYLSLVDLREETTLRNEDHAHVTRTGQVRYEQPPVHLNLYLLFAFEFGSYDTSLLRLSETVELFQSKRYFTAENETSANPFPAGLERLVFDFHNLSFEQMNHLWGVLGGRYLPSVLYQVRLVRIQRDQSIAGPGIRRIRMDTSVL